MLLVTRHPHISPLFSILEVYPLPSKQFSKISPQIRYLSSMYKTPRNLGCGCKLCKLKGEIWKTMSRQMPLATNNIASIKLKQCGKKLASFQSFHIKKLRCTAKKLCELCGALERNIKRQKVCVIFTKTLLEVPCPRFFRTPNYLACVQTLLATVNESQGGIVNSLQISVQY